MFQDFDTICAISTPKGIGGISIIRISGRDSVKIIKKIFTPTLKSIESHKIYYGFITNNFTNEEIDEVLVSIMLSPKTYTKEDIVEINCHGGYIVSEQIIKLLLKNGCRIAEPGEFTKRAFLNGRIDLTQAEGIIELINSKNFEAAKISETQLKGNLKKKINYLKEILIEVLSIVESSIDFDEDVENTDFSVVKEKICFLINETDKLLATYNYSKNLFEGIQIVIAGMPNVGKSSLLNYFLKENRAIISNIPGTTRDTIEEELLIAGIRVKLIDTAGLRNSEELIEQEGIKRAFKKIEKADIVIYLFDLTKGLTEYDKKVINNFKNKKIIIVGNKYDLNHKNSDFLKISIKKNINLDLLENEIKEFIVQENKFSETDTMITNLRQFNILENFQILLKNINMDNSFDIIAFELKNALDELGKITGETTSEDILDKIFQNFCIGK